MKLIVTLNDAFGETISDKNDRMESIAHHSIEYTILMSVEEVVNQ